MDGDQEVATACQYINAFYSGAAGSLEISKKWIEEFSMSDVAWTVCDRILTSSGDPLATCFAAQTIRQKILKSLNTLPRESLISLRESLLNHLSRLHIHPGDQMGESTMTQLCLSIADLYIQVPEWNNWINELLNTCNQLAGDRTRMMLTLLKVFPEEVQSIKVGENRRRCVQEELAASATAVIQYLGQLLIANQTEEDIIKRILFCVASYISNPAVNSDNLSQSKLIEAAFQVLAVPSVSTMLHDAASECLISATFMADNLDANLELASVLQKGVYGLTDAYKSALAHDDTVKLQNFARIFAELNETLLTPIVNNPTLDHTQLGSLHSLDLLLLLAHNPDYTIIERTFNVWYRISEGLFSFDDDDHLSHFRPYVSTYISALYHHSRFEPDEDGVPDENNDFMMFRFKVVESLKDVVYIIGTEKCVQMMYELLAQCASSSDPQWHDMEAALFIISSIVHNLVPEEDGIIPQLLAAICSLPPTYHPAIFVTSTELIGGCDEWLQKHVSHLDPVMTWLCSMALNPMFASYSTDAIEKVCNRCSNSLVHFIPNITALIPQLEASMVKGKRMERAVTNLLRAFAALVNNLSPEEMKQKLAEVCTPIIVNLAKLVDHVKNGQKEPDCPNDSWLRVSQEPMMWVDRVASIFKEVKPWHSTGLAHVPAPWLEVTEKIFDVLSQTMALYESNARHVEHCCRSIRHLIRSLGPHSHGFVGPLVTQMLSIYGKYQHSCFLYLGSILVDEYGTVEAAQPILLHMTEALAIGAFSFLGSLGNVHKQMQDNPDIVEDLFRLSQRFVQRAPSVIFGHGVSKAIFECAITALPLDHPAASRSITRFLVEVFDQLILARKTNYRDAGVVSAEEMIKVSAGKLMIALLRSSIFHVSPQLARDMAEIVNIIGKFDRGLQRQALEEACGDLRGITLGATDDQLRQFVVNVTTDPSQYNTRDVCNHIRDLKRLYN